MCSATKHGPAIRRASLLFGFLVLLGACVDNPDSRPLFDDESRWSALVGPEVDPIEFNGNETCGDFIDDDDIVDCKIEPVEDGEYDNQTGIPFKTNGDCDPLTVVLNTYQDADGNHLFDWEANLGIDAVVAKAKGGNFYWYTNPDDPDAPGEIKMDDGLHAPTNPSGKFPEISHVSFCWDPEPDLNVSKTASSGEINATDTAQFSIVVENGGIADADDTTLYDSLPATANGWSVGGPDGSACTTSGGVLTCDFGTVAPGGTREVTLSTTTDPADCGWIDNSVEVSASNEPLDLLADNTDDASIYVACPDLSVMKVASNSPISAGDDAQFVLAVANLGPGTAYGVTLADVLPGTGWSLSGANAASCAIASDVLSCDFGDLLDGESRTVTLTRATTTADCDSLSNQASVTASNEPDDALGNNSDDATIAVNCPDIKVQKTALTPEVTIESGDADGESVSFQIDVTNLGPGTASDVTLDDTLPGTGWTVSGTDAGDCTVTPGADDVLHCDFGAIGEGETRSIVVSLTAMRPDDCGDLPNTATVSASNELAADSGNNESSATITVLCPVASEGCTPGYWRQAHHFDEWTTYSPDDLLGSVFDLTGFPDLANDTLFEAVDGALDSGEMTLQQLLRHAVAALLNAANPDVDYSLTEAEIISMTDSAIASGDYESTKDAFEAANEEDCPLD